MEEKTVKVLHYKLNSERVDHYHELGPMSEKDARQLVLSLYPAAEIVGVEDVPEFQIAAPK